MKPKYTVIRRDQGQFPWVVVDDKGEPVLYQPHPKVGEAEMGFSTQGLAQQAADQLNGEDKSG